MHEFSQYFVRILNLNLVTKFMNWYRILAPQSIAITKISQPNASKRYLAAYFKLFSIVYDNSQCSVRILIFKKYNCIASLVTDRGILQQFSQLIGLDLKKLAQQRHSKGPELHDTSYFIILWTI